MSDIMRVKHNDVAYWAELLEAANREKNLTTAAMARLAARLLRVEKGKYGRRLNDDAKQALMAEAYEYLKTRGFTGRASRRGEIFRTSRDALAAARRKKMGAPWYWNLSSVRSKGINADGIDRSTRNTTYRNALIKAMKTFANQWEASGQELPVHGFF